MAFWGVEVKPGKPFTLKASQATEIRRLHLSQATLGLGYATTRSILQCKVGNKGPLFLCILSLEKVESCQLNLEFEEADEVIFSVIGPRSVHLTGYFLSRSSFNGGNDDESESFGKKRELFGKKRESYGKNIVERNVDRASSSEDYDYSVSSIDSDDDLSSSLGLEVSSSVDEAKTKANKRNGKGERQKKKYEIYDEKVMDKRKDKPLGDVKIKRKKEKRKISAIDSSDEEETKSKKICQGSIIKRGKKIGPYKNHGLRLST